MSKINQIQNGLRELDGGAFQKLCDAYLHKRGYNEINSLGSVIGSDKVRTGTPDTFVPLPNGKYVFAEYTTQRKDLYDKLKSDLDKCLDQTKCGITVAKIEEIVICHTSQLSPKQHNSLAEKSQVAAVNLNIFGLSTISWDLYQKYPGLARDFLQVEVDTGQILSQQDFVSAYDANKAATPLSTEFRFREEELSKAVEVLEKGDLLIITGRAGVGKSRLALECCTRFVKTHAECSVRCILNRGADLFEDLRVHFAEPGEYLVFVDDANRTSRFEYVTQLLQFPAEQTRVRIVATVRDYAAAKIKETAQPCGGGIELELKPFGDKQIRELVSDEYGITNPYYLERIAEIAQGNPRLAAMAATVAARENTLQSISDVAALYDEYYRSIRCDLEALGDPTFLKAGALVAFFRAVDRTNADLMGKIKRAFDTPEDEFWEAATKLHDMEIVDMYEDEVVRMSDQVLGTYLFFVSFFRRKTLDFGVLMSHFFPDFGSRLVDAIHPVLSAFDSKAVIEVMRPHVDERWAGFERNHDDEGLLHLMRTFWYVKETDTLLRLKDWIDRMLPEPVAPEEMVFTRGPIAESSSVLSVLGVFRNSSDSNVKIAVSLLLAYVMKRPSEIPKALHTLIETFGFDYTDAMYGFSVQRAVVDVLWDRARDGEDLPARIFLAVAQPYLYTRFSTMRSTDKRTVTATPFCLPSTVEVKAIRRALWDGIFSLHEHVPLQEHVLALIKKYSRSPYEMSVRELVADDAQQLLAFIESKLDPTVYFHCAVVQDYLGVLEEAEVTFDHRLQHRFQNETWRVAQILMEDYSDRADATLEHEAFQEMKKHRLAEFARKYTLSDYQRLIQQCQDIEREPPRGGGNWLLREGLQMVFRVLSERDAELYVQVLGYYLRAGDPLDLAPFLLVKSLVEHQQPDATYEFLKGLDYARTRWMGAFFECLEGNQITQGCVERLLEFYKDAEPAALPFGMDFLLKYQAVERGIFPRTARIILGRSTEGANCVYVLSMLFNPQSGANKALVDVFAGDLGTLKEAYIALSTKERHDDYDGQSFARILDADPNFLIEYINAKYHGGQQLSRWDETRNYTFLWRRDDYKAPLTRLLETIHEREREHGSYAHSYLLAFFEVTTDRETEPEVAKRQDEVIKAQIKERHHDTDYMRFLFALIAELPPERRRPILGCLLEYNKGFETFAKIDLEPSHWSWSGSAVPMYHKRIEYLESLLPLLDTADLLKHKQLVERCIQGLRSEIEREKKRDFIDE